MDYTVAVPLLTCVVAWVAYKVIKSGLLGRSEVSITESPAFVSKALTVYYKHNVGHYKGALGLINEVKELMPQGATTFGIYYDDPDEVPEHLLQSAAGVVFGEDGENLYTDNYAEQLTRWGYERMILPVVKRSVQAQQPFTGMLSLMALVQKTYVAIKDYVKEHRLETAVVLEFYANDQVTVLLPLDHQEEFIVSEHLTLEQLETKLARKKFDSDEEDSESDPEAENDEAEEADDEKPEEEKKDE